MTNNKVFNMVLAAIFAAATAVLAQFQIPIGVVPMTLQATGIFLMGILLGKKWGTISALLYGILGAIGLPVFAGGASGIGVIFGPTGGYIFAFVLVAYLIAWLHQFGRGKLWVIFTSILIGAIVMLLIGTIWLKFVAVMSFSNAFLVGFVPFIIPNGIQVLATTLLSYLLLKRLPKSALARLEP